MATPLSQNEISEALKDLKGWEQGAGKITKHFQFNDFSQALGFIVRVGVEAEKQVHHPALSNVYKIKTT